MLLTAEHVHMAFKALRDDGIHPNRPSTKWDVLDPRTDERFPPKAVLRVAKQLAKDPSRSGGGGWPTNDVLKELGFEIVLKEKPRSSEEASDIADIQTRKNLDKTTREQLIEARLGQGWFRDALLKIWSGRCALTGCDFDPLLRASHIKPWRDSNDGERLDPNNGFLLFASVDALFDRNFLSFSDEGRLLISQQLSDELLKLAGINRKMTINLTGNQKKFLEWHRKELKK